MCSRLVPHYGFSVTALPVPSLSFADIHEAIAATRPDQDCIVFRDRRLSWADVTSRTRRLANFLISRGLGCHTERTELS
jgi:fatty-acyl-CoA synthase